MKKFTSFVLIAMMIMSLVSVAAFTVSADEPATVEIGPYGSGSLNGWENWSNQTQLLITTNVDVPNDYLWEITLTAGEESNTVRLVPSSSYDTWLDRFEVCLGTDGNQFVPVNGTEYTVSANIYDTNGKLAFVAAPTAGFICGLDPIVPDSVENPANLTIGCYGSGSLNGWENWSNQTQLLITTNVSVDNTHTWELTIAGAGEIKTINLKASSEYDTWLDRFEVCLGEGENQFIPVNGEAYVISAKVYDAEGNLAFVAAPTAGFICGMDPIVPEPTPDTPVEPEPTTVEFVLLPYSKGMENWENSPNKGDAAAVTQILFCPKDADNNWISSHTVGTEWTLTLVGSDGSTKTVTLPCTTVYNGTTWGIIRVEPCLAEGENQFVPVVGVTYTLTATTVVDGVTYTGTSAEGAFYIDVEPIVPAPVDPVPTPDTPVEPEPTPETPVEPDPTPDTPVEPDPTPDAPATGDATVFAIVLATVALMGMAVVVTKKVRA